MRVRRSVAAIMLLLPVLAAPVAAEPAGPTVTIGMPLEPPNLDPTVGSAAAVDEVVYANVFEGLTRIGRDGTVAPALATDWTVSEDGLSWTFNLRPGVRFHDGTPFDAGIVKFSLERVLAPDSANAAKAQVAAIRAVTVPDPLAVRIELARPMADLPLLLGWGDLVMVAPASAATNATNPVGTGPFRFAEWRKGDSVRLVRNPDYWGPPARVGQVVFRLVADAAAAYAALLAGDVQAFPNFPSPENLPAIGNDGRFQVVVGSTEGETILAINNGKPPFDDIRVRRALAHAIDRRALIDGALSGHGQPIGSHFPPHHPAYLDLTGRYPYDPAEARRLLAEAGYPDGFATTLKLPPVAYARRGGEVIAAQLAQVGIRAEIQNIEWAQWLERVYGNRDYDLTIVAHTEPLDYDIYARSGYYFAYESQEFRALVERLSRTTDEPARTELLHAIQRRIADDAVNVFLFQLPKLGVWDKRVTGLWADAPIQATDVTELAFAGPGPTAGAAGGGTVALLAAPLVLLAALSAWALRRHVPPVWLAGRLGSLALTLALATLVVFLLVEVLPGDPAATMMGLNASPEALAALRAEFGLDGPAWRRYLAWVAGLVRGDLGVSYTYRVPVAELVAERLWVSLPLALYALALTVLIALPVGILAAVQRERPAGAALMGLTQVGLAVPNFWLGILLVLVFAVGLNWVSAGGFPGWQAGLGPALAALTLPALALALPQASILARVLRSALVDTLAEDYVRTARAKGLTWGQALRRHALANALIPVLTILGLQFSFLIAGGIIIETVFSLPGLGRLIFQAVSQRDLIVVKGVVVLLVFAVVLVTTIVDLLYTIADPRLRGTGGPRRAAA